MPRKIDDTKCAPGKKYEDGSCFTDKTIKQIAKKLNKHTSANIDTSLDKTKLIPEIEKNLSDKCDHQVCWTKLPFLANIDDITNTFRPIGPDSKKEWLSTIDISKVMDQYESKYPEFEYLGTVPSDFLNLSVLGFDKLDFNELIKKGKTKIGMVINLDPHTEPGSHWVSLFADFKNYKMYFFDSFGKKPIKNIKRFINIIVSFLYKKKFGNDIPIKYLETACEKFDKLCKSVQHALLKIDIRYNEDRHQRTTYECGVYSMNFILRLLNGDDFDTIIEKPLTDKEMNNCRSVYFSNKYS